MNEKVFNTTDKLVKNMTSIPHGGAANTTKNKRRRREEGFTVLGVFWTPALARTWEGDSSGGG
jgi:hypothetical protein